MIRCPEFADIESADVFYRHYQYGYFLMKSTEHWIVHNHSQFEVLLCLCRDAAEIEDWWALEQAFNDLGNQLKHHLAQEEEVLFPAFEAKYKVSSLPTSSLRNEHSVLVHMFRDTAAMIKTRNPEAILEALVALESLMIKHHEKEEDIFLPMASHILFSEREELSEKLENFALSNTSRQWGF